MDPLAARVQFTALGGHDSSDEALASFAARFGERSMPVEAGVSLTFASLPR